MPAPSLSDAIEEADTKGRFSLWSPFSGETPIYVHAKLMVIDDQILRIGSANLNNRSMGLDSECDVFIDSTRPGNEHAADNIAALRYSLLAEHCGLEEADMPELLSRHGSMIGLIEDSQGSKAAHSGALSPARPQRCRRNAGPQRLARS